MTAPLSNATMMAMETGMIVLSLSVSLSATVNKRQWHDICMYIHGGVPHYHNIYHAINNESIHNYTYILWKTEEKCVFVV